MPALRLGELVATFALAQDNAFGQPLESQLRSCLLATWMAEEAGYDAGLKETVYWTALLRYLGCTGHAHEVAVYLGDEIAARARTLVHDAANPAEVASDVIALASVARPDRGPGQVARAVMATIHEWAVSNFGAGCEVADLLAYRLGFSGEVRQALACTFERWNGAGVPRGVAGEDIPLAMRVVHVSHDMEAIARLVSPGDALAAVVDRRDRTYDPALADLFATHGAGWLERLAKLDPWDAVLDLEPTPAASCPARLSTLHWSWWPTSSTSSRPTWPGSADGPRIWSTAPHGMPASTPTARRCCAEPPGCTTSG
jgi:HD domain